jgi:hypothetical protein
MTHKVFLAAAAAVAFFVSAEAGVAFPVAPISTARSIGVTKVTFWARPFPYGYAWSLARACTRHVPVETSRGLVTQRVWVCDQHPRREVVVHYKG